MRSTGNISLIIKNITYVNTFSELDREGVYIYKIISYMLMLGDVLL